MIIIIVQYIVILFHYRFPELKRFESVTFILPDDFEHFCGLQGEASLPEKMPQSAPLTKGEDGVKRYLGNAQIDLALFIQNPLTLPK